MTPWLDDGDLRLYHGDALQVLSALPDESVDCVVTSPPYWGLRDYGAPGQMGLEPTPDLFVAGMVELFREVRRVLAAHGTCWVNLGDSYAGGGGFSPDAPSNPAGAKQTTMRGAPGARGLPVVGGLKAKDLVGIPWRVAFALQADGWWLRSDIIWAKPNPMPESVTDRPTKSHEYVFLLTKQPRYWFDTEAVREPHVDPERGANGVRVGSVDERTEDGVRTGTMNNIDRGGAKRAYHPSGRNVRSVWNIATQPYPEAHFATFPEELARRCILAGCPVRVCRECGKPSERIVEASGGTIGSGGWQDDTINDGYVHDKRGGHREWNDYRRETLGWSDCGHNNWRPGLVLDPFIGSGTTAKVARDHQRHAVGIELNAEYLALAARRLQQLSLLADA